MPFYVQLHTIQIYCIADYVLAAADVPTISRNTVKKLSSNSEMLGLMEWLFLVMLIQG